MDRDRPGGESCEVAEVGSEAELSVCPFWYAGSVMATDSSFCTTELTAVLFSTVALLLVCRSVSIWSLARIASAEFKKWLASSSVQK